MKFAIGNDRLTLPPVAYRGRIAPTPTGYLHLGHARTFSIAHLRARERGGELVYRAEDLDPDRCKAIYADAALEDLRWLGLDWDAGPDVSEDSAFWVQSQRHKLGCYLQAWRFLKEAGYIYPCQKSRKDLQAVDQRAPEQLGAEVIFPESFRPDSYPAGWDAPGECNWRFRVDYQGVPVEVVDGNLGKGAFRPGLDFGDFLVWRRDGFPAYELAVVVDDILMRITEVVRGADLWVSTARQLELYRAFGVAAPAFFHCDLVKGADGKRLAKRAGALAIRELRASGFSPEAVLAQANSQV